MPIRSGKLPVSEAHRFISIQNGAPEETRRITLESSVFAGKLIDPANPIDTTRVYHILKGAANC
jgi:hypothetical protein